MKFNLFSFGSWRSKENPQGHAGLPTVLHGFVKKQPVLTASVVEV